jgi:hypothetical protein
MTTIALLMVHVSANLLIRIVTKFWIPSQCFSSTFHTYQYLATFSNVPLLMCHTIGEELCKGENSIIKDISLVSYMILFHLQNLCLFFTHYSCLQLHVYWDISSLSCRMKIFLNLPKITLNTLAHRCLFNCPRDTSILSLRRISCEHFEYYLNKKQRKCEKLSMGRETNYTEWFLKCIEVWVLTFYILIAFW